MHPSHSLAALADADAARVRASRLFLAVARADQDIDDNARLRCIAAAASLTDALPIGISSPLRLVDTGRAIDPSEFIRSALHVLGSLSVEQFAAQDIRAASEHGRRALYRLP
jgi:hypothetical protein